MAERTLPLPASSDVSTVTLLSDGEEVSREHQILSITVSREVNRIPTAKLVFLDGDVAAQEFRLSDQDLFKPGKEIEIRAGYHSQEETIFKGIVVRHGLRSRRAGSSILSVICKHPAVKMTVGRHSKYFFEATDSDVLEEIIDGYGLTPQVDSMSYKHKAMVQYQATDWDFLISRAEMNGKVVLARDGEVAIETPDPGADPILTLSYGATVLEFETDIDVREQLSAVTTTSWSPADQGPVETEAADPGIAGPGNLSPSDLADVIGLDSFRLHHGAALEETELQAWSDALLFRSHLAKVRGRIRCQGIAAANVGDTIELDGMGERFNGLAYVSALRHEITTGNWVTDFQIGLSTHPFYEHPNIQMPWAAGALPPIGGLHVGIVTKLEGDPDGESRIRVRLPLIDSQGDGIWVRVATLDAGNERGSFFLPEIEDEVIVGFLHGDPRQGVMLGMVHSSAKPAPIEASDDNHEKGFVTREKIKCLFNDEKKSFRVETPGERIFTLDDDAGEIVVEDPDGNKITLSGDGVVIESSADIQIKAGGDVNIEGTNVNLTASAQLKAEGSAGAELSSGGTTDVKGSLVQIN